MRAGRRAVMQLDIPANEWMSANGKQPHWAEKNKRTQALQTRARFESRLQEVGQFRTPVVVTCIIGYPTAARADPPNAYPTCKCLVDGIVKAGVLPDDNSDVIVEMRFRRDPVKARKNTHRVTILIDREGTGV